MNTFKFRFKIAFLFNIVGVLFTIIAIYMPLSAAYKQFFSKVYVEIDFLILIEPYLFSLIGSIFILVSAMITSKLFKVIFTIFIIEHLSIMFFFVMMIFGDTSLSTEDLFTKNNSILYLLYGIYSIAQLFVMISSLISIKYYNISCD